MYVCIFTYEYKYIHISYVYRDYRSIDIPFLWIYVCIYINFWKNVHTYKYIIYIYICSIDIDVGFSCFAHIFIMGDVPGFCEFTIRFHLHGLHFHQGTAVYGSPMADSEQKTCMFLLRYLMTKGYSQTYMVQTYNVPAPPKKRSLHGYYQSREDLTVAKKDCSDCGCLPNCDVS